MPGNISLYTQYFGLTKGHYYRYLGGPGKGLGVQTLRFKGLRCAGLRGLRVQGFGVSEVKGLWGLKA